jgi:hypothetical protein
MCHCDVLQSDDTDQFSTVLWYTLRCNECGKIQSVNLTQENFETSKQQQLRDEASIEKWRIYLYKLKIPCMIRRHFYEKSLRRYYQEKGIKIPSWYKYSFMKQRNAKNIAFH